VWTQSTPPGIVMQPATPTDRYTRLPDALLSELTPREHQLVHALLSYRWTDAAAIYPSIRTLARQCGCSDRTVQRTLRALERRGYVVSVARFRADEGQTSSEYRPGPLLLPLLAPPGDTAAAGPGDTHGSRTRTPENDNKRSGGTGVKHDVVRCSACPHAAHRDRSCSRCGCRTDRDYYQTRSGRLPMR
jgi:hypothetical protein